ncbi:MAG: signal peptide peptidase SppA [bacterium]
MRTTWMATLLVAFFFIGSATAGTPDLTFRNPPSSRMLIPEPIASRACLDATSSLWLNPAGIGLDGASGMILLWPASSSENVLFDGRQFGAAFNLKHLAFGWESFHDTTKTQRRYSWGFSAPLRDGFSLGAAYHWSTGLDRGNTWDLGFIARPTQWFSLSAQVTDLGRPRLDGVALDPTWHLGMALRPFGPRLTLSMDATLWHDSRTNYGDDPDVSFLANWEVLKGLHVHGGYAVDSKLMFAGVSVTSGVLELGSYTASGDNGSSRDAGDVWVRSSTKRVPSFLDALLPKQIVHIRLEGPLGEEPDPVSFFFPHRRSLLELLDRLEQIRFDDGVAGVILEFDNFSAGRSDLEELRIEILALREAGIKVATYAQEYRMGTTYLASAADRAWLYPAGVVIIPGISFENLYARDLLDTLRLRPEYYTVGEYKSAAEPLVRNSMSDEAREELEAVADAWHRDWVEAVSSGRSVPVTTASAWIDSALMTGPEAVSNGLLDGLLYPDEVEKTASSQLAAGISTVFVREKMYTFVPQTDSEWAAMNDPKIAVVYAEGRIDLGKSRWDYLLNERTLGSETLVEAIRQARSNRSVKAIVLRVDSPGGWSVAADAIAREVQRTVDRSIPDVRHIPLIVSMSDLAASGGYYISAQATSIVATRTTITGSIGVVYGRVNISGLLDTLGVHLDGVHHGRNAAMSGLAPWNDEQVRLLRKAMDKTYDDFIETVARGRGLSKQEVDALGRGRIWTGEDAIKHGLVDAQGGILDAIRIARDAAEIPDSRSVGLVIYPRTSSINFRSTFSRYSGTLLPEPLRTAVRLGVQNDNSGKILMLAPLERMDVTTR